MAISGVKLDRQRNDFSAVGASGTAVVTIAIPTDTMVRMESRTFITQSSGGHEATVAMLVAKAVYLNNNGSVTNPTALASSANPDNSGGLVAADAECSTIGGSPTANYTINSTNGILTVTNSSASAADITVLTDVYTVSNVVSF